MKDIKTYINETEFAYKGDVPKITKEDFEYIINLINKDGKFKASFRDEGKNTVGIYIKSNSLKELIYDITVEYSRMENFK